MAKDREWTITIIGILFIASAEASLNLADSANCFSVNFYKKLASYAEGNVISSPFSLDVVMSMLMAGAGGTTAEELKTALGYDQTSVSDVEDAFKSALGQINAGDGKNTLTIADSMWIQQGFSVKQSYKEIVTTDFFAEEKNVDFAGNAHKATREINDWVNSKTKGLIKTLFDQDLDPSTIMVLVNAIYFKGVWKYKFDSKNTKEGIFHTEDSSNPSVPLMNQKSTFNYKQISNAEVLEMNYVGDKISMQLILPTIGTKMADFENSLSCSSFGSAISSGVSSLVDVTMPKFDISSSFNLVPPLKQSGIKGLFSPSADLSGISGGIYVNKVIQKAVVKVYEEGSEAAAVTGAVVETTAVVQDPPPVIYFNADRPFLFLIKHKPTNLVLFMGRVKSF